MSPNVSAPSRLGGLSSDALSSSEPPPSSPSVGFVPPDAVPSEAALSGSVAPAACSSGRLLASCESEPVPEPEHPAASTATAAAAVSHSAEVLAVLVSEPLVEPVASSHEAD